MSKEIGRQNFVADTRSSHVWDNSILYSHAAGMVKENVKMIALLRGVTPREKIRG